VSESHLHWLLEEFGSQLASVFETMAGERPKVELSTAPAGQPVASLVWKQPFQGIPGELFLAAPESVWTFAAEQVLRAAGMPESDAETLESTYLETLGQALGGLAQAMSARLGKEVTPEGGQKIPEAPKEIEWSGLDLTFPGGMVTLHLGPQPALLEALTPAIAAPSPGHEAADDDAEDDRQTAEAGVPGRSKTFDLLLDVEMPVSVSFGRAKVPLKDVLKLTTGSIVELNRSIVEPVEIIVNNCVIARGEVVVVEGNFGVRVQEVVSRKERLRTLN
jgi:flagellar motor switch protein FliN/FliY